MVPRSIPRTEPALIASWEHRLAWTHEPVVGGGLVALAGRRQGAEAPELAVLDVSGAVRFRADLPPSRATTMPGRPSIGERVRIVAIAGDRGVVRSYSRDGALEDEWALPPIVPEGIPHSLNARVIEAGAGNVVVSWCEDANRTWRNELHDGDGRVLRSFPGRLLGETTAMLVLATFDTTGRAIVGRQKSDGEERWSLPMRGGVIATGGDGVIFHDGEAPRERWQAPSLLVEIDDATGRVRWTRGFDGEITSVVRAQHLSCALELRGDGSAEVHRIGTDGKEICASSWSPLPALPNVPWDPRDAQQVLAVDHTHLLLVRHTKLVCEMLADPGRAAWTMDLPPVGRPYATVADGTIAIAGIDGLFLYGESE